jgi:putative ATPase
MDARLFEDPPAAGPVEDPLDTAPLADPSQPLAARLRPRTLDEVVGQEHLVGPDGPLRAAIDADRLRSVVLWGPPGTGKTSLAQVVAAATRSAFVPLSAVTAGVKDVRAVLDAARTRRRTTGRGTVLFIDELHRFNKAQQDALLPGVEEGAVVLLGATTENPSFEVIAPLMSRSLLYRLEPLSPEAVRLLLERALTDPRGLPGLTATDEALAALVASADGDARAALTGLEAAAGLAGGGSVSLDAVRAALTRPYLRYDKADDNHYDQVSALIKSVRGSDPDAALYWLVRMLASGEDPRFVARRLVILASEDIGLADPGALGVAVAAFGALERVGLPEARFALAEAAVYLALAPKSNSLTAALGRADDAVRRLGNAPVPAHLRDAHYRGATALGHGAGYRYPHDDPRGWVDQRYLPEGLDRGSLYRSSPHGAEPDLNRWRAERTRAEAAEGHDGG